MRIRAIIAVLALAFSGSVWAQSNGVAKGNELTPATVPPTPAAAKPAAPPKPSAEFPKKYAQATLLNDMINQKQAAINEMTRDLNTLVNALNAEFAKCQEDAHIACGYDPAKPTEFVLSAPVKGTDAKP